MRLRQGEGALDVAGAGVRRKAAICGSRSVEGVSGSRRHAIGEEQTVTLGRVLHTSDKKGNDHPRCLGEWSDILRYFADHELIRGLVAACKLHTAVPQMNPKQAANIYGAALSSIREAIQGGWQVADDTFLVVTLLLYIYERFYWPEGRSSRSWMIHIQGAISLVQARGLKQVQTKVGRVIFRKARDIILDVAFCNSVVPPYFLILGSQAMGRDVLYRAHDQLAILETRTIVLYQQYRRGDLDQAFLQTAHTLQQDLMYRQKMTVRLPCNSLRHRQGSGLIDGDEQEKEDEYLTAVQDRWSGAKLHIFRLVVCRVQSAVFRRLWNTSSIGFEELVPCCQNCPTRTSEIMCNSAADVMDDFGSIHLLMHSPSATLGMHGAIFTASSCLESELEELTLASCGVQSDAIITPTQLNSMRRSSRWLTEWSRMLAS
ncbi:hypothetical protein Asppvi_001719 [Aspergillus pseudoviridinutans]|uniref:Uncharacterized protein n=1 Tax=Aspergillus pseudoviridinutans TaxID=1517512 RepID=A0A9P3ES08_9EURO|nr:uncharacterized protein Asppvi_001719 [Aspergillus pseudoviridinutans]GIJ83200.1 hypothetical protein Asppvi_001719 [Aspergillus pseudoviridinutans]